MIFLIPIFRSGMKIAMKITFGYCLQARNQLSYTGSLAVSRHGRFLGTLGNQHFEPEKKSPVCNRKIHLNQKPSFFGVCNRKWWDIPAEWWDVSNFFGGCNWISKSFKLCSQGEKPQQVRFGIRMFVFFSALWWFFGIDDKGSFNMFF